MVNPKNIHLIGAKHVMRYLKGTLDYGLRYTLDSKISLHGFTDSDWEESAKERQSTSGFCFSLGLGMISWFSRKKTSIELSTAEAKYIASFLACSEEVWLRNMLAGVFDEEIDVVDILCDNQSCIKMKENTVFHDKSKHIEVIYHFIRDMV